MQSHQIYIETGYTKTAQTCSPWYISFHILEKKLGVVGTNRQFCVIFFNFNIIVLKVIYHVCEKSRLNEQFYAQEAQTKAQTNKLYTVIRWNK